MNKKNYTYKNKYFRCDYCQKVTIRNANKQKVCKRKRCQELMEEDKWERINELKRIGKSKVEKRKEKTIKEGGIPCLRCGRNARPNRFYCPTCHRIVSYLNRFIPEEAV